MDTLVRDLVYAFRVLWKSPGFTAVVVATLAIGIGVNVAVFSLVDGILLRALPFRAPDRLVRIAAFDREAPERLLDASFEEVEAIRRRSRTLASVAAFSIAPRHLWDERGEPATIEIARVSGDLFGVLGVSAVRGRVFLEEELQDGARVALLSHRLWRSRYGSAPEVLGESIEIQGRSHVIVGILPAWLTYPVGADVWRPFAHDEHLDDDRELYVIARLAAGAGPEESAAEIDSLLPREELSARVVPLHESLVSGSRGPLFASWAAVALVLLVACANVAGLWIARNHARSGELAVRCALGASRLRIARQIATEALVLAAAGGLAGLLLGSWVIDLLLALSPAEAPRLMEVRLDDRVLAAAGGLTLLTGLGFGIFPALDAGRARSAGALGSGAGTGSSLERRRIQRALVVGQVAVSTLLLVAALLLATSLWRRTHVDRGFESAQALVVPVAPLGGFASGAEAREFFENLRERLQALPGVREATFGSTSPMEPRGIRIPVGDEWAYLKVVDFGYFRALGVPLLSGREFREWDDENAESVAVVDRTFRDALRRGGADADVLRTELAEARIVGVVENVVPEPWNPAVPTVYLPFRQVPVASAAFVLRTSGPLADPAPLVRDVVWEADPAVSLDGVTTIEETIARSVGVERFQSALIGAFALLAGWLAALGIYGVASFTTRQRWRELGLRCALGADRRQMQRMIGGEVQQHAGLGVALGLVGALLLSSVVASLLYATSPTDPAIYSAVGGLFVTVAVTAAYLPARSAGRVDPTEALRAE